MKTSIQGVRAINKLLPHWKGTTIRFRYRSGLPLLATMALFCLPFSDGSADSLADPNAFKLGPGDHIQISVFGEEDLSMEFRLNDTGTLNYPFLGELKVEGLSVIELEQLITSGLKGPYLVNPDVTVSIREYRPFFLHGEVQEPGGIAYQPGLTLQKAVVLAGGFTERAAKKKIMVIRSGDGVAKPITLNDPVEAGDVITVHQSFF
ncbi:MAG: polysaccharide export protein [Gammaproteobacteria bacterium]|nr:polysaccharide export protein [Gammaproteobacteria bacterium]